MVERPEVEGAVPAVGEPVGLAQELAEEPVEVEPASGEHAQVAVQGQDEVLRLEGGHHPHRDRLLADAGEPLREPPLAEQAQHLLLDQARPEQLAGQLEQVVVGEVRGRGDVWRAWRFGGGHGRQRRGGACGGGACEGPRR
jgi:hypothetical protein